ncbi:hypothetical protein K435DRAFT_464716 [Dendrothele bispora CBS 962.96]|uniref:Uncharacterized protein n=1 Tax=Dendrothele bispora (strain CBS 962.96) TaxID=1314807 RepID=A0A4S8L0U9_DENBC|nr:hypothetical protein K435DRAFT_464716 [Dendrothele bispora CBS 962.96]
MNMRCFHILPARLSSIPILMSLTMDIEPTPNPKLGHATNQCLGSPVPLGNLIQAVGLAGVIRVVRTGAFGDEAAVECIDDPLGHVFSNQKDDSNGNLNGNANFLTLLVHLHPHTFLLRNRARTEAKGTRQLHPAFFNVILCFSPIRG